MSTYSRGAGVWIKGAHLLFISILLLYVAKILAYILAMKIGRNEPCPCGSGKKYKKCCLNKENVSSDLLYRRLGEAHDRLVHRLMQHGFKVFGENALGFALDEFMGWPDEGLSDENLADHEPLFYPWFIFNWEYGADPDLPQLNGPEDMTIAELYAADKKNRLNHLEAQIIEATVRQPYSFYEIQEVRPGEGYRLKDIFCGTVSHVVEKKGSENARRGQILFGRVVQIDTVAMLIGCGTVLIPPKMKPELIRFRQRLAEFDDPIDLNTLYDYDLELRELYFNIYSALMQPPELQNTDGDPLMFHTIHYEIDAPGLVFEKLKDLSATTSEAELRLSADLDESGRVIRAEIPWNRKGHSLTPALENTILGRLVIEDRRLKIEVNSARRAENIRREIKTRLGRHARCLTTEIQSPDAMLETTRGREDEMAAPVPEQNELMQIPEVREQIEKAMLAHWENWVDEKIPALGYLTPRQAVKTPDGRESVEALLLDAEMHAAADEHMRDAGAAAIAGVRRRLGLDKPEATRAAGAGAGSKADRVAEIAHKIEAFGRTKLDPEHTILALKLCDKIGRMRKLSIQRGRAEIWAAAIISVIARLNFLFDPDSEVYITADELDDYFGTKKSTVSNKAGTILKSANIYLGDPEFSSATIADMFRFYETEDGFVIPGSIRDSLVYQQDRNEMKPSPLMNPAADSTQRRSKPRAKGPVRDNKKKDADDRQLKLFDDEP
jgi:hypothetical protein